MDPVFTFTKKVKDGATVREKDITDKRDASKLDHVIQRLDTLPRIATLPLSEANLSTNPKRWIESLLGGYPALSKEDAESLLHDFTDSMKTRMREETKYALALLLPRKLLLCHSVFGEETITPDWKTIPRMLDVDNILRYACFYQNEGVVLVKYWEREATSSFMEWLGLPRKQAFLFGGKYRLICDIDGITTELQLSEEEIDRWLADHPELKQGEIHLHHPIQRLAVSEVRAGPKRYDHPADFIQDFNAEKFGVPLYQATYRKVKAGMLPLLMKYYDERTALVRKEGDSEVTELTKGTPEFDIIFADGDIELRATYASDITRRLVNGEELRLFHAGAKFSADPTRIGSLQLYNELSLTPALHSLLTYYRDTNLQDTTLDLLLRAVLLSLVSSSTSPAPVRFVCGVLRDGLLHASKLTGTITKLEDDAIEYKAQDVLRGNPAEVVLALASDLRSKLATTSTKVYIIGVEDAGAIDPIPSSRLRSDRLEAIRAGLVREFPGTSIHLFPAIHGDEGILLLVVFRPPELGA